MIARVNKNSGGKNPLNEIDFSPIRFPSDKLTIGAVREKNREWFDHGLNTKDSREDAQPAFFYRAFHGKHACEQLGGMLRCERVIAAEAFAEARGIEGTGYEIDGYHEQLVGLYIRYGLATGLHHAAEMIRDIEQQGRKLADQRAL